MAVLGKVAPAVGEWIANKISSPLKEKQAEETTPLTYRDVEHIRAQMNSSIEASKRATRGTDGVPPSGKPQPDEDWRDEPTIPGIPASVRSATPPQR
jgi:hypothetical protein